MQLFEFHSDSPEQTERLANELADCLCIGLTLALNGELGSGKTTFVRSLCGSLGVDTDFVNSPTFVLLQQYTDGRFPVAHFDTYRLGDVDEFLAIGGEDFLYSTDYLCLIEWAERIQALLPPGTLHVEIQQTGASQRLFRMTSEASPGLDVLKLLQTHFPSRGNGS